MTNPTQIDDDHFLYDGGMRQCISGFGDNAKECLRDLVNHPHSDAAWRQISWHIDELVRWCRGLNRELKELRATVEERNTIACPCCGELTVVDTRQVENCDECGAPIRYDVVPLNPRVI